MTTPVNRRELMAGVAAVSALTAAEAGAQARMPPQTPLRWLDGVAPTRDLGQTWGVPWPRGTVRRDQSFALRGPGGAVPVQSWPIATWPDGSLKWSAHAIPAGVSADNYTLTPGAAAAPIARVSVRERPDAVEITNGPLLWRLPKRGASLIATARRGAREILRDVKLTVLRQDKPELDDGPLAQQAFTGSISTVTVEQRGPVRAVVKIDGTHRAGSRALLPFSVRLYFHAGADHVRIMHSFVYDADENTDFIRGIGVSATAPMRDQMHDRHIRFSGEARDSGVGVWGEAVRSLTGLRRNTGAAFRQAQVAGRATPPLSEMEARTRDLLHLVPAWGDFTLSQTNADGFQLRKRTKEGHGWIDAAAGRRASGLMYAGGPSGGVGLGVGDFWQRCPTRLDIRNAETDAAEVTAWLWSPDAPAMDLRFYHDGMGQDTHAEELQGLDITYEDYEKGWGKPYGIARTSELLLFAFDATPPREMFSELAQSLVKQPRLMCTPERLHAAGVFGDWALMDRSTPARARIEAQNDYLLAFYMREREQRRWYGFWHYGDVMHTQDADRHMWRYDIGGYGWDNSELSPDLWLWYSFLRSGRADVFRFAEAMTRHTGEVDVYHIGDKRGMGTRHGVQHWADSSKQPRVSNAAYRRIYYYLTADERVGDLMHELIDSDETLTRVFIGRKLPNAAENPPPAGAVRMEFGTSWCSLLAAWLTEWERTGDTRWRDRIVNGMTSLAALPKRWLAGGSNMDLASGHFLGPGDRVAFSHLNAVFGAVEVNSELLGLLDVPTYRDAWLDYCRTYNAPDRDARVGQALGNLNLREGHSRLTAYAAKHLSDRAMATRAWTEFFSGENGQGMLNPLETRHVGGADVLDPIEEDPRVTTNTAAQWGLAAIQNLALVGDALEGAAPR